MAAAQMPKFHTLSIIQDQLRGSGMNLIPCVCVCVCVCARARVRVCVWGGRRGRRVDGRVCESFGRTIVRCVW